MVWFASADVAASLQENLLDVSGNLIGDSWFFSTYSQMAFQPLSPQCLQEEGRWGGTSPNLPTENLHSRMSQGLSNFLMLVQLQCSPKEREQAFPYSEEASECPCRAGCSTCPVGRVAPALGNWIGFGPQSVPPQLLRQDVMFETHSSELPCSSCSPRKQNGNLDSMWIVSACQGLANGCSDSSSGRRFSQIHW